MPYFVARQKLFVARNKSFVARIKSFVARIKSFVARIKSFVARIGIRDGRIDAFPLRDRLDDADNEKFDARIDSIEDFDASLTPGVARTLPALPFAIGLDAIVCCLQQEA